jgi:hypothetical protein
LPNRDAPRENQPIVCTLHRGMTRGLLDAIAPETKLAGFVSREPESAGLFHRAARRARRSEGLRRAT